jgi:leucyl aminopeptidase
MIQVKYSKFEKGDADIVVIPMASGARGRCPAELESYLNARRENGIWKAKRGDVYCVRYPVEGEREMLFLGLGEAERPGTDDVRAAFAEAVREIRKHDVRRIFVLTDSFACGGGLVGFVSAAFEGLCFGDYAFEKYKSVREEKGMLEVSFAGMDREMEAAVEEAAILSEATLFARDLVNEPPNVLYPEALGEAAVASAGAYGYDAEVLGRRRIEALGMESFLAVGKGSVREPQLIVLRYCGDERRASEILGLVGKGITFDSGGNNLKPSESIATMKNDMAGAAAVIGAMNAIAKKKLPINVAAVVAAAENIISGDAYKPGDIIGTMSGKTVEIENTDAEGRLTLADAVCYAITKEKVTRVVDVATLTGAALVALGRVATAAVTNDRALFEAYERAAEVSDEKVWLLPSFEEYMESLKSDVADYKNVGGREAGVITGGLFVGAFAEGTPWMHLDIAGTAWSDSEEGYLSKGGTGVCVRSLYHMAKNGISGSKR